MPSDYDVAIATLMARAEAFGVGAVKLSDGELFIFTKDKLLELLGAVEASGKDRLIVFVKTGPEASHV